MSDFPKPNSNPLVKLLATGLADHEGEKWSKHRRLINPVFNLEKLKVSSLLLAKNILLYYVSLSSLSKFLCKKTCNSEKPAIKYILSAIFMQHILF